MLGWLIPLICVFFVCLIIFITCIKVVKQTEKVIIERVGKFHKILEPGIHLIAPFVDRVASRISMKEQVKDFAPQAVITKDNVTMQINTVVFYCVTDPKLYTYGVEDPVYAIDNLTATTLRNVIGELDLDETLTSRDIINNKMRVILDEATDPWGIKVNRVEVKDILPPKDIREAMERQMRAEREKREQILLAEGKKQSAILLAEGNKEKAILEAEAEKQVKIKTAEGEAQALLSVKEAEAKGILLIREAEANGLKALKDAGADEAVLKLKGYEALSKVADGQATKIIIPSELSGLTSAASVIKEVVNK